MWAAGITHVTGIWDINGWNLFYEGLFTLYYYYILYINWAGLEPRLHGKNKFFFSC